MMSFQDSVARLHCSVAARLSGLTRRTPVAQSMRAAQPRMESLEDRLLLSATLLVDAGIDQNANEGDQLSFTGTFEDTDTGGGTPGTFDVLQLASTGDNERFLDIDGNRAVWESNGEIFFFDGTTDLLNVPNVINITGNTSTFESDPHISGDHIVYAGPGIKAYNITTGTTISLAPSTVSVANPEIDGDIAVWSERSGSFFSIMMADLSVATPVPVAVFPVGSGPGATGNQRDPKISGDNVIWEAPGAGGFNDVFIHNLTTGITTNASNTAFEDDGFQIDNGVVVWSGTDPSVASPNSDVYVFDGRGFDGTGTAPVAVNLGSASLSDVVPKVSGANIVWDGNADVFIHNLDTSVTENLTNAPSSFLTEPDISGSNVTWSNGNEILLYNIDTEVTTNISSSSQLDTQALVSGNNVVWLGRASFIANNDVFFATGQADPPTFTIDWDFGDGTVLADTTLEQDHTYVDNGNYSVTLTVTASDGRVTSDILAATVDNVAPNVAPIAGQTQGLRGETFSFSSNFTDPGTIDTHVTEWSVTDSGNVVVATGTGTTLDFTPDEAGTFDVTFTVTDNDGGVGSSTLATTSLVVLVGPDPLDPSQTTLRIAGSNGRDIIRVRKDYHNAGALKVIVYEVDTQTLTVEDNIVGVDRIIADGRAGNDAIKIRYYLGDITTELYGGDGNDWIRGGSNDDFISGGDGNDLISGGSGRDFLIGGLGNDFVIGHNDDDILVGGVYSEDRDLSAVRAVQAEWSRTDISYADRIANLTNGTGLNGTHVLDGTTIFDDNATDILLGLRGLDWFHANDSQDYTDQRRNEDLAESENDFIDVDVDYVV